MGDSRRVGCIHTNAKRRSRSGMVSNNEVPVHSAVSFLTSIVSIRRCSGVGGSEPPVDESSS